MKGLIIGSITDTKIIPRLISDHLGLFEGKTVLKEESPEFISAFLPKLISGEVHYDYMILPLTLSSHLSLDIAREVHLNDIPIKLILLSATDAPEEIIHTVFDCFIPQPIRSETLIQALEAPLIPREQDLFELQQKLAAIRASASCFRPD